MVSLLYPQQRIVLALTPLSRLRGIRPYSNQSVVLCIAPCKSIHTFSISTPIDVAFVNQSGYVIYAKRNVKPKQVLSHNQSVLVLERWAINTPWYSEGDSINF